MVTTTTHKMTAQAFLDYENERPDARLELVDGEVRVAPSASDEHSYVDRKLTHLLLTHIEAHDLGVLLGDVSIVLGDHDVRRPDLFFVSKPHAQAFVRNSREKRIPELAIEILSPSNALTDRREKFNLYARSGIANYWIIDPLRHTAEAYVLENGVYRLDAQGDDNDVVVFSPFPQLRLDLAAIWPPDWFTSP